MRYTYITKSKAEMLKIVVILCVIVVGHLIWIWSYNRWRRH